MSEELENETAEPESLRGFKLILISIVVSLSSVASILFAAFFLLLSWAFFGNFHLGSFWHGFVLCFTFVAPFVVFFGLLMFCGQSTLKRGLISILISAAAAVGIYLIWSAEASRMLVH